MGFYVHLFNSICIPLRSWYHEKIDVIGERRTGGQCSRIGCFWLSIRDCRQFDVAREFLVSHAALVRTRAYKNDRAHLCGRKKISLLINRHGKRRA